MGSSGAPSPNWSALSSLFVLVARLRDKARMGLRPARPERTFPSPLVREVLFSWASPAAAAGAFFDRGSAIQFPDELPEVAA